MNKISIIGCLHGDEIIGKKVIDELKKLSFKKEVSFLIANKKALAKSVRYISTDLNRSFPGKDGAENEEGLAFEILKKMKGSDLVIDIHATNSNFDKIAIVPNLSDKTKILLRHIPIKKIVLLREDIFGGKELMNYVKLGVALDYGPDKSGSNYKEALKDVKQLLINLNALDGEKTKETHKELFEVQGLYENNGKFKPNDKLKEFQEIKTGDLIGTTEAGEEVLSDKNFFPVFLGKGKYENSLCLISKRKEINL